MKCIGGPCIRNWVWHLSTVTWRMSRGFIFVTRSLGGGGPGLVRHFHNVIRVFLPGCFQCGLLPRSPWKAKVSNLIILKTSTALEVSKRGSQNRNSSEMTRCVLYRELCPLWPTPRHWQMRGQHWRQSRWKADRQKVKASVILEWAPFWRTFVTFKFIFIHEREGDWPSTGSHHTAISFPQPSSSPQPHLVTFQDSSLAWSVLHDFP